jgi:hypothetical protein
VVLRLTVDRKVTSVKKAVNNNQNKGEGDTIVDSEQVKKT